MTKQPAVACGQLAQSRQPRKSIEYVKVKDGRLASTLLVFERLHWPEALAELQDRAARQGTPG
jgi:hypothetical protein